MEPVPLPVELDAVPVPSTRHLLDVPEAVLPYLWMLEVPRQREPRSRLVAEHPFRMLDPQARQLRVPHRRQIGRLRPAEVVVVHPHRGVHLHPKLVPSRYDLRLRVLPARDHAPDVLMERVGLRALVHPPMHVPDRLQHVALPSGRVLPNAPEMRPDLRLLHRPVDLVEKLLPSSADTPSTRAGSRPSCISVHIPVVLA